MYLERERLSVVGASRTGTLWPERSVSVVVDGLLRPVIRWQVSRCLDSWIHWGEPISLDWYTEDRGVPQPESDP